MDHRAQLGTYQIGRPIRNYPAAKKMTQSWLGKLFGTKTPELGDEYRIEERCQFLGEPWFMVLGVVQGFVFKISARWSSNVEPPMKVMLDKLLDYCFQQFGEPSKPDAFIWKTEFGTVSIQIKTIIDQMMPSRNLFLIIFEISANLTIAGYGKS